MQRSGCGTIAALALTDKSERLRLGAAGAVEVVVCTLKVHRTDAHVQDYACQALHNLIFGAPDNRRKAVACGGVGTVRAVAAAFPNEDDIQREAADALGSLRAQDDAPPSTGRSAAAGSAAAGPKGSRSTRGGRSTKADEQGGAEGSRSRKAAGGGGATAASSEEDARRTCLMCGVEEGAALPGRDAQVRLKLCGQCRMARGAWILVPLDVGHMPAHQSRPTRRTMDQIIVCVSWRR
jgi:hypothetical protein